MLSIQLQPFYGVQIFNKVISFLPEAAAKGIAAFSVQVISL
jgi:hypothetical protein